ncbi:MAG TPA: glycosyltransferase family 2 protein [Bryobacteraceae bacterium]|nr:glycosyltransferase family 2 protein [Bryobacteraceae bacterium]
MSISAIIPVWNGREWLERLLASLAAQTSPAEEILAVDNGSTDHAPELAQSRGARVIPMGRNAGFAAAVNRGIAESRGDWVAVLNTDVELAPDYFAALKASATERGAWFATGKILAAGTMDRLDGAFDLMCRGATAWRAGHGLTDGPSFSQTRAIWSAPWTAAIFRRDLFRRVGLLEETFESYLEDVDFGVRCALEDCSGVFEPSALAWHRGSAALGTWHPATVRRMARNQAWLVARHYPNPLPVGDWWAVMAAQALWGLLAFRHGAGLAWLLGKWDGLHHFAAVREAAVRRDPQKLYDFLRRNEALIREWQRGPDADFYWRMYFLLTAGEAM